jgi:4-methyl-5(b-hydroxyethyl)-thiazole monophosphate biosynthesis
MCTRLVQREIVGISSNPIPPSNLFEQVTVTVCGRWPTVTGNWGLGVAPDVTPGAVDCNKFAALCTVGGFEEAGASRNLANVVLRDYFCIVGFYEDAYSDEFRDLIVAFASAGKWLGAIDVGALTLAKAGVLRGRRATTSPGHEGRRIEQLLAMGATHVDRAHITDGHIITGAGSGAAIDVALSVLEGITSARIAEKVRVYTSYDVAHSGHYSKQPSTPREDGSNSGTSTPIGGGNSGRMVPSNNAYTGNSSAGSASGGGGSNNGSASNIPNVRRDYAALPPEVLLKAVAAATVQETQPPLVTTIMQGRVVAGSKTEVEDSALLVSCGVRVRARADAHMHSRFWQRRTRLRSDESANRGSARQCRGCRHALCSG